MFGNSKMAERTSRDRPTIITYWLQYPLAFLGSSIGIVLGFEFSLFGFLILIASSVGLLRYGRVYATKRAEPVKPLLLVLGLAHLGRAIMDGQTLATSAGLLVPLATYGIAGCGLILMIWRYVVLKIDPLPDPSRGYRDRFSMMLSLRDLPFSSWDRLRAWDTSRAGWKARDLLNCCSCSSASVFSGQVKTGG